MPSWGSAVSRPAIPEADVPRGRVAISQIEVKKRCQSGAKAVSKQSGAKSGATLLTQRINPGRGSFGAQRRHAESPYRFD